MTKEYRNHEGAWLNGLKELVGTLQAEQDKVSSTRETEAGLVNEIARRLGC